MYGVFQVADASPIAADRWLVRGRVLRAIRVGDVVYGTASKDYKVIYEKDGVFGVPLETKRHLALYPFVVLAAMTYRIPITWLDRGLTGDFIIQGEHGEILQKTELLLMLDLLPCQPENI